MAKEIRIKLTDEQKARIKGATGKDVHEIGFGSLGNNLAVTPHEAVASPRAMQASAKAVSAAPKALQASAKAVSAAPKALQASAKAVSAAPKAMQASAKAVSAAPKAVSASPKAMQASARTNNSVG